MGLFKKKLAERMTLEIAKGRRSGEQVTVRVVVKHTFDKSKKHVMFVDTDRNADIASAAAAATDYVRRETRDPMWHSGVTKIVEPSESAT